MYLSEESRFQQLSTGMDTLRRVGFPASDVFTYDSNAAEAIASGSLDWCNLELFDALSRQGRSTICVK